MTPVLFINVIRIADVYAFIILDIPSVCSVNLKVYDFIIYIRTTKVSVVVSCGRYAIHDAPGTSASLRIVRDLVQAKSFRMNQQMCVVIPFHQVVGI